MGSHGGISSLLPATLSCATKDGKGIAFAFLSLVPLWHSTFLLTLFLPPPQGLSIFEHLGVGSR